MGKPDKGRLPPFVPLLISTLDAPAWKATSHGAKALYVALRRRVPRGRNRSYVSYRDAERELKSGRHKIREWFAELEHYGFIKLAAAGCLGVDGKGKAPHWSLTELGTTNKASAGGLFEPPTHDFLRWDGVVFDPKPYRLAHGATAWDEDKLKKQNPVAHVSNGVVPTSATPLVPTSATPKSQSGAHGGAIERARSGAHVSTITSLTTTRASPTEAPVSCSLPTEPPTSSQHSPEGALEGETKVRPSEEKNNVVHLDPRTAALEAAEKRRKLQ